MAGKGFVGLVVSEVVVAGILCGIDFAAARLAFASLVAMVVCVLSCWFSLFKFVFVVVVVVVKMSRVSKRAMAPVLRGEVQEDDAAAGAGIQFTTREK